MIRRSQSLQAFSEDDVKDQKPYGDENIQLISDSSRQSSENKNNEIEHKRQNSPLPRLLLECNSKDSKGIETDLRDKEIFDPDSPILAQNNFESDAEKPLYISSSESHS